MKHVILRHISALAVLGCIAVTLVASRGRAQILSHGDLFGPGAPPPMAGVEIGFGQHAQMGTLDCTCGSQFSGGTGTGFIGSLFFELPIDYDWAVGIKGGIDFKNVSIQSPTSPEVVVVVPSGSSNLDTGVVYDYRTATIKTTYLDFAPYVQYQFYRMGPFVQAGLDVGFLTASSFSQYRQLPEGATVNTAPNVTNLTFPNGTLEEEIPGENGANSLRLGLLLSAGYNIQISERSIFSPLITYDFPLTVTGNTLGSNWKIGSLYASALIKFQL